MASPRWAASTDRYALHLQALGRSPETVRLHLCSLRCWERYCASRHLSPLRAQETACEGWLASLYGLYSRNTVSDYFKSVRSFFRWTGADNPFLSLPCPKPIDVLVRPYSFADLRRLLAAAQTDRDRAIILLLLGSGLRSAELVGLRFTDVDWTAGTVTVVGKGSKPRTVCPGERAMWALGQYANGNRRGYLFPSPAGHLTRSGLWLMIARCAKRAGIDGGVHRFRHSFSFMFLENGGDAADLQVLLGHSTLTMTLRYVRYHRTERALEAQRRFNPADRLMGNRLTDVV